MNLESVLKSYGLTQRQAKVYLACLELGSASVQRISELSQLPRSTCYEVLESLKPLGLISSFQKKKIKWFSPADPHSLIQAAKERASILEQSLPQFLAAYGEAKNRPTMRFYQGKKGMKIILDEILNETQDLLSFSSFDDMEALWGEEWTKFVKERTKNKTPVKVILRDSPKARERQRLGPQELREVRLIPADYNFHGLIFIWSNKIAMFSLQKELIALVIESEELAQVQRSMFYVIWDNLKANK